jgi:hypothetical protein
MSDDANNPDRSQGQHEPRRAVMGAVLCVEARIHDVFAGPVHDADAGTAWAFRNYDMAQSLNAAV